jgi:hypothetical protein
MANWEKKASGGKNGVGEVNSLGNYQLPIFKFQIANLKFQTCSARVLALLIVGLVQKIVGNSIIKLPTTKCILPVRLHSHATVSWRFYTLSSDIGYCCAPMMGTMVIDKCDYFPSGGRSTEDFNFLSKVCHT